MHLIDTSFNDFDQFKRFAVGWDLDFKLLSKNNFSAYLNMYANETFQLGRTSLKGTIHQNGLVPPGFRSIVLPANNKVRYNWLHRDVTCKELLIFPRNGNLESVSFDNFDVFVLSISEQRLEALIENFGFLNAGRFFNESEKYLRLKPEFLVRFSKMANTFLAYTKKHKQTDFRSLKQLENQMVGQILYETINYIDRAGETIGKPIMRKRDIALKKSVDLIIESNNKVLSVSELCKFSQVSERTLEYAFIEKYQVSPSQYIKAHRLNLVKNNLLSSKDPKVKVSEIAGKYGFWHMGQFAKDFKIQFGKSPSKFT